MMSETVPSRDADRALRRSTLGVIRIVPLPTQPHIRNLTPHAVRLIGNDSATELPPDGPPARLVLAPDVQDGDVVVNGVTMPLVRTSATADVVNLPEPVPGVLLIVARPVAEALLDRDDLLYPHRAVRDENGTVVGCRALGRPLRAR